MSLGLKHSNHCSRGEAGGVHAVRSQWVSLRVTVTVQQTPAHVAIVFMPDNSAVDTQEVMTEALRSTLRNDKHRTNNSICSLDSRYDEVSHETRTQIFLIKKKALLETLGKGLQNKFNKC